MKEILILGAGISGMTAALELKRNPKHQACRIVIVERESQAGGLLHGTQINGYNFDNGCYVYKFPTTIVNKYRPEFRQADFNWKILLNNAYQPYPPDYTSLSRNSSLFSKAALVFSMISGRITKQIFTPRNAQEWLNSNLGKKMIKLTHLNGYLEKLQGITADKIHVTLCETRLGYLRQSVWDLFRKQILKKLRKTTNSANVTGRYYPINGTSALANHIYRECVESGIEFVFKSSPSSLVFKDGSYELSLGDKILTADLLISTIPLPELVRILPADPHLLAFPVPQYTTLYVPMFVTDKLSLAGDYVILYSFDLKHIWKRVVGIRQPDGKMAVIVEVNLAEEIDKKQQAELLNSVSSQLSSELGLFSADEVLMSDIKTVRNAYPIFRVETYNGIRELQLYIQAKYGIKLMGRQGRFAYISSDEAVEEAIKSVANL